MYQHYRGVDRVILQFDEIETLNNESSVLDLKLEWDEEGHENANVPMYMYERACITDAKDGVEVRSLFLYESEIESLFVRLLLVLVFQ
jgi:hypothetical protein